MAKQVGNVANAAQGGDVVNAATASEFLIASALFNELLPQKSMLSATSDELLKTFSFKSASSYDNGMASVSTGIEEGLTAREAGSVRVRYQADNSRPLVIPIRSFFNMRVTENDAFDYATATQDEIDALPAMYEHMSEGLVQEESGKIAMPQTIRIVSVRDQTMKNAAGDDIVVYPVSNYKRFQEEISALEKAEAADALLTGRKAVAVDISGIFRNQTLLREIQLEGVDGVDFNRFPKSSPIKDVVAIVL